MLGRKILATFVFEFYRSLTTSRIVTSVILAFFAPVMLTLIGFSNRSVEMPHQIPFPIFFLGMFHLLAVFLTVLLWATPVVYSELEGKTWTYLAIRPNGKFASTMGKYLNAVFWALLTTLVSLTLSCLVVYRYQWDPAFMMERMDIPAAQLEKTIESMVHASNPLVIWFSLAPAILLGAMALSAIFVHIGLIAHKRGMIFAVSYGIVETVFSFLPANVRYFTVGFHLRNLGLKSADFEFPQVETGVFTDSSSIWVHLMALLVITVIHVAASMYWLHSREYITAEEA